MIVAADCLALSILKTGDHYRGETISSALWELEQQGKIRGRIFRPVVDFLFRPLEADHCAVAYLNEHYLRNPNGRP
jgi:hypothetical protein